jgi:hypothetical protein
MNPDEPPKVETEWQRERRLADLRFWIMVSVGGCIVVAGLIAYGLALFRDPPQPPMASSPRPAAVRPVIVPQPEQPVVFSAPKQETTAIPAANAKQPVPDAPGDAAHDGIQFVIKPFRNDAPEVAEARAALERYLKTTSWKEKLALVFNPERCEPFMREFYEKRAESDPQPGSFLGANQISANASNIIHLDFTCSERPETGLRANFHRNNAGHLLLNWETWTAWGEKRWEDFKQERSSVPVLMRALASESKYYNYEFSDSERWLSVKLRSADNLHSVTGYVERNSKPGIKMAGLIGVRPPNNLPDGTPLFTPRRSGAKSLVTVRLAFPPDAQSDHCVMITSLLADRWILFPGEEN